MLASLSFLLKKSTHLTLCFKSSKLKTPPIGGVFIYRNSLFTCKSAAHEINNSKRQNRYNQTNYSV